jgi:predicted nucleic acid-binding protein
MKSYFADACYWIALATRKDQLHSVALAAQTKLTNATLVTTDEVLTEVLNHFGRFGPDLRQIASQIVESIRQDQRVRVVEQSRTTFDGGLAMYKARVDKEYSHVDCVSFSLMTQDGITEALTNDHHFEQEGFVALMRQTP